MTAAFYDKCCVSLTDTGIPALLYNIYTDMLSSCSYLFHSCCNSSSSCSSTVCTSSAFTVKHKLFASVTFYFCGVFSFCFSKQCICRCVMQADILLQPCFLLLLQFINLIRHSLLLLGYSASVFFFDSSRYKLYFCLAPVAARIY